MVLGTAYEIANWLSAVLLVVCVLVLIPLSVPRKTRGLAATGFLWSSVVFGITLWFYAVIYTYAVWGLALFVLA
jgi:hypothetical protein